jgi:hypothetical protein
MSDLFWFLRPPYSLLTFGVFLLILAVVYTYAGKVFAPFHGWIYRADEPKRYWLEVAIYYLGGVCMIALSLYRSGVFSN